MHTNRVVAVCLVSLVAAGRAGFAACDPTQDPDRSDIANARAFVADRCDCDATTSHGAYVKCAVEQASAALQNGSCAGAVKRCAARSTCGRPGFVTCCVTTAKGTRSGIKRDAAHCRAPRNGSACAGSFASCCDACTATGCATTTSTSSTTTTTTTLIRTACTGPAEPPLCGGTCPAGEQCGVDYDFTPYTNSCGCFPNGVTPCGSSDYPQCGGACFGNEVCQAFHLGPDSRGDIRTCACVDPARSCTTSPTNTCTPGPCPPGAACSSILQNGTESCDCRTP